MIKVLHVRNCRGITTLTGPETYLLDLLAGFDGERVDARLACVVDPAKSSPLFLEEARRRGIRVEPVEISSPLDLKDFSLVRELVRRYNIELVHTHDARSDAVGSLAARSLGVPVVAFAHGWLNWDSPFSKERLYAAVESFFVGRADEVICASRDMERDLMERGVPRERIHYIPYGIDLSRFDRGDDGGEVRAELGVPSDAPLVGTVGRMHPWKGHRHFIEAAARVVGTFPQARFLIVGDAAFDGHLRYRDELRAMIERLGLTERVILTGSRPDIPRIMRALDLFVLPSLREPFGIVSIEAQACATPVVGSRVDGIPETMEEGVTGLLVEPGDSVELAEAVERLLSHRERLGEMGEAGRSYVRRRFGVERMVAETERLYRKMLRGTLSAEG
ncbi:MAG TPA: glycosyltransferase family 1 protein [Deltaproteobacteria bacterium]|nr:glycosyltransferase family 1 protein [Deltaproteobacteria bacterium]